MTLRTKNVLALSLIGSALALGMTGFSFSASGTFASVGPKVLTAPLAAGAVAVFIFCNWFLIRTLTGIRLLGRGAKDRPSVRQFSWLLLMLLPILLAGPVWVAATQGALLLKIAGGALLIGIVLFYLLVPASNGTLAIEKFKKLAVPAAKSDT